MPTTYENAAGRLERKSTEDYLCDKFLDLVEEKPFYRIKVRELVEHAGVSRSTFYTYFSSIFDVAQKLEDDFLEGFYSEDITFLVLVKNNEQQAFEQLNYIKKHGRTLRLLCGPNGDAGFTNRIERALLKVTKKSFDDLGSSLSQEQRQILAAHIAGGALHSTLFVARHGDDMKMDDFQTATLNIIKANNALLGVRE